MVWGGIATIPTLMCWFCKFYRFFSEISSWAVNPRKPIFPTIDSKIFLQKWFSLKFLISGKTRILQLHFGIFTFPILPFYQKCHVFETLVVGFFLVFVYPYFEILSIVLTSSSNRWRIQTNRSNVKRTYECTIPIFSISVFFPDT